MRFFVIVTLILALVGTASAADRTTVPDNPNACCPLGETHDGPQNGDGLVVTTLRDAAVYYNLDEFLAALAGDFFFDDFAFQTSTGDWNITGSVGFDGSLDYRGKVILSSSASENLDFLGPFKDFLGGSSGDIVVPFRLTGTYSSPKISLDASPATGNTDKRIKDESRKLFDKLFKKN